MKKLLIILFILCLAPPCYPAGVMTAICGSGGAAAAMSCTDASLLCDTLDSGDGTGWTVASGTPVWNTSQATAMCGASTYSVLVQYASNTDCLISQNFTASATAYTSFYFKWTSGGLPDSTIKALAGLSVGTSSRAMVGMERSGSDYYFVAYHRETGGTYPADRATTVPSIGTWYKMEIKWVQKNAAGYELKITPYGGSTETVTVADPDSYDSTVSTFSMWMDLAPGQAMAFEIDSIKVHTSAPGCP